MIQNHLLQILTMVAMEDPTRYTADNLRNEKMKVLVGHPGADRRGGAARPVVAGAVRRLPLRAGRAARLEDADLRGGAAGGREPALARRAVLPAQRQGARRTATAR